MAHYFVAENSSDPVGADGGAATVTPTGWSCCADGCNSGVHQQSNVHVWNDGTYQLRNMATNKYLYDDSVALATRACKSSPQQSWWAHKSGDKATFRSQDTNECLDDSQYGLRTITCYYNRHQTWR